MRIKDDIFYTRGQYSNWYIDEVYVKAIREFRWTKEPGYYLEYNICISMKGNLNIIQKYNNTGLSNEDFFNRCMINLQFFVRLVNIKDISPEFIKDNNIMDYHIKLINMTYFDEDIDNSKIVSADKRPFGNSNMIGDIAWVVDPDYDGNYDELEHFYICLGEMSERFKYGHIYDEVMELIIKLSKLFPIRFRSLIYCSSNDIGKLTSNQREYYKHNWCPDISEFRDIIIDEIIK